MWLLFWLINLLRCIVYFIVSISDNFKSKELLKVTFTSCRKSISLKIYYMHHEMTDFTIHQKSILSPVQPMSATNIDRIKYYLDTLVESLWKYWIQDYFCNYVSSSEQYGCQWDSKTTVSSWKEHFIKSLREDLVNTYLILSILVAKIGWIGLRIDPLWTVESVILWCV